MLDSDASCICDRARSHDMCRITGLSTLNCKQLHQIEAATVIIVEFTPIDPSI